ncbi:MAG: ElyC/SanA/YdcF family protein, partial [Cyanobacteria bacterium J06631_9]
SESRSDISINTALAPRLIYASDLYEEVRRQRGVPPVVLVTAGAGSDEDEEVSQPRRVIRDILIDNGVFGSDIRIENTGLDIYSSGVRLETLLEENDIIDPREQRREPGSTEDDPRVVVVAPAIIMTRAALTLERMNLEVIAKPTDFYTAPFETDGSLLNKLPDLLPSVDALQLTTRYWNEFLSSMYYFLRGWLPSFNFGWDSSIEV